MVVFLDLVAVVQRLDVNVEARGDVPRTPVGIRTDLQRMAGQQGDVQGILPPDDRGLERAGDRVIALLPEEDGVGPERNRLADDGGADPFRESVDEHFHADRFRQDRQIGEGHHVDLVIDGLAGVDMDVIDGLFGHEVFLLEGDFVVVGGQRHVQMFAGQRADRGQAILYDSPIGVLPAE